MDWFRKKALQQSSEENGDLKKCLSVFDLIFLGMGAIIGAGIFILTGIVAATKTGPAIVVSYVVSGLACAFSALSYAELAASIGGCGSAYGYAYAGFGELLAWIVGWDLLLEYSISVSAVSVGWGGYFNDLLSSARISLPPLLQHGPLDGGIINCLPMLIILMLTVLLAIGVKSSTRMNNLMVFIKLTVIFIFIITASKHLDPHHWLPFAPFGWSGVVQGASLIFFAYIGFDAVSTAAEEAINPQRDLPIGIIGSLIICTVLYIIVSAILTGITNYSTLNVASPVSHTLLVLGHKTTAGLVAVGAITGLTTVMLVLFYGLSRVFLAMARDGLLPAIFAKLNTVTQTPLRIIVLCGGLMAMAAGMVPINELAELVNIGTLFAFMVVCGGVLVLRYTQKGMHRPFTTPLMPYPPILGILCCGYLLIHLPKMTMIRFIVWMFVGLVVYVLYGRHHALLNQKNQ